MIKKLAKQIKRKNKKRSINITLGTVVGLLLSCSIVIKADDIDLTIGEKIEKTDLSYDFLNDGNISGSNFDGEARGLYIFLSNERYKQ